MIQTNPPSPPRKRALRHDILLASTEKKTRPKPTPDICIPCRYSHSRRGPLGMQFRPKDFCLFDPRSTSANMGCGREQQQSGRLSEPVEQVKQNLIPASKALTHRDHLGCGSRLRDRLVRGAQPCLSHVSGWPRESDIGASPLHGEVQSQCLWE